VTRDWRKLRNEELHHFYCSLNIVRVIKSRRMRWTGHVARMLEKINVHRVLVGKPEGKSPFGNPSGGWEDIVKVVLKEMGW
jgi:hypothetical protein